MLLLTAFEPFDWTGLNSSEQALREFERLHPRQVEGVAWASVVLPVVFDEDVRALNRFCDSLPEPPRAILHLGQTTGALVAVERRAANRKFNLPAARATAHDACSSIDAGAPPFLDSTFPSDKIVQALRRREVPCCASQDAGSYLCNHILFRSLQRAARDSSPTLIGFVHLPRLPEQLGSEAQALRDAPALELQVLARAVETAARVVVGHLK